LATDDRPVEAAWCEKWGEFIIQAMPELPEVETVVRDLRPRLIGRWIAGVEAGRRALRHRWLSRWQGRLAGRQIGDVRRRGKWILLCLDDDSRLVIHLGMTGQLTVTAAGRPPPPHTHLVFRLDHEEQLRFRDVRRFGGAVFFADPAEAERFFHDRRLGPEPFELEPAYWRQALARTRRCLKAVLLDQHTVAGVGNIYADESLFEARLHPACPGCQLGPNEAERLRRAVVTVLERAIARHGSSIRDYVGGNGQRGGYQNEFRVYSRTGQPCVRCRTPIRCLRLAGRATHFCPRCQQAGARPGRKSTGPRGLLG
jgi:formamidopyrimidine-DNA glycosylase